MGKDTETFLTRDQILNVVDTQEEEVPVPEWGGKVLVRGMTGAERDQFEAEMLVQRGRNQVVNITNFRAKLVSKSIIDPKTKEHLFKPEDIPGLAKKSAAALQRVIVVAQRLSGLTIEDIKSLTEELGNEESVGSGSA